MADEIQLKDDSKYRVAYDLMLRIEDEEGPNLTSSNARGYYLQLYRECLFSMNRLSEPKDDDQSWKASRQ